MSKKEVIQVCEHCEEVKDDLEFIPNPFAQEIYHDDTKQWLCEECINLLADSR